MSQLGEIAIPFVSWDYVSENPFFAANAGIIPELETYMDSLRKAGDSCGARIEVVANATDLTNPPVWKNGVDEGLIFRSIRDGAGLSMPAFKTQVDRQEDIWHLVNFIRSLWPEALRPQRVTTP